MADPVEDPSKMDMFAYSVFWKTKKIGLVKEVDPTGVKPILKEQKATPFGDMVLGHRIRGSGGSVKAVLHQCDLDVIKYLCPWFTTGSVAGVPADLNFDTYANAGLLTLHPYGVDVGTTTNDVSFLKAFPIFSPAKAGGDWRELPVEFFYYPDRAQLPVVATWYYGAPPA